MKLFGAMIVAAVVLLAQVAFAADTMPPAEGGMAGMAMPQDGDIVHTELYVTDLEATQSFYGDLFGWTFMPMMEGYVLFSDPSGQHMGGLTTESMGPAEPGRMSTVIYLYCSDITAKLAEVEAHGGAAVMPKMAVPTVGYIAIFTDPSGNPVGLFTGDENAKPEAGGMGHN